MFDPGICGTTVLEKSYGGYLGLGLAGKWRAFFCHKPVSKSEALEVQTPSPEQSKKEKLSHPLWDN